MSFEGGAYNHSLPNENSVQQQITDKGQRFPYLAHECGANGSFVLTSDNGFGHTVAKCRAFQRPVDASAQQSVRGNSQAKLEQRLGQQWMMFVRVLQSGNRAMPVNQAREKTDLPSFAGRQIGGVFGPGLPDIISHIHRQGFLVQECHYPTVLVLWSPAEPE